MKKFALMTALAAAALVSALPLQAATVTANFNVNITLTSSCSFSTAATDINLTYTSFQGAAATGSNSFAVKCTNNLPYALTLDGTPAGLVYSYTDVTTALPYTLTLSAGPGLVGNSAAQTYTIAANIAGGLSGNCATAGGVCNNSAGADKNRTITITY